MAQYSKLGTIGTLSDYLSSLPWISVTVTQFGASGDGVTDDTSAIQAAIDYVKNNGRGEIFFPTGTYIVSSPIIFYSNMIIRGNGREATRIHSQQYSANAEGQFFGTNSGENYMFTCSPINDADFVTFKDFSLRGPGLDASWGQGIYMARTGNNRHNTFENLVLEEFAGNAIKIDTPILTNFKNVRVRYCAGTGYYMNGGTSACFDNCFASSCLEAGFRFYAHTYAYISGGGSENNGVAYRLDLCNNMTLIATGCEGMKYRSTKYPGVGYWLSNGRNNTLISSYASRFSEDTTTIFQGTVATAVSNNTFGAGETTLRLNTGYIENFVGANDLSYWNISGVGIDTGTYILSASATSNVQYNVTLSTPTIGAGGDSFDPEQNLTLTEFGRPENTFIKFQNENNDTVIGFRGNIPTGRETAQSYRARHNYKLTTGNLNDTPGSVVSFINVSFPYQTLNWLSQSNAPLYTPIGLPEPILKSVSIRQTVLSGPKESSGKPSFLPSTSGSLTLTTTGLTSNAPLIVTASNGWYAADVSATPRSFYTNGGARDLTGFTTNNLSWTLPPSSTSYLYVTVNVDGSLTTGNTTLAPVYQYHGTPSTTINQSTFNIQEMIMYVGGGTTANQAYRVFVGEAITDASSVTSANSYVYMGRYSGTSANLTAGNPYTFDHNIGTIPYVIDASLINETAELGYTKGDICKFTDGMTGPGVTRKLIRLRTASSAPNIVSLVSGTGQITYGNWRLRVAVDRGW
ncbi:MAG: hypothetical protein EBU90_20350 [Proteobacteria bacterium]|nr:hypothetical protein [Pseudomonadota bacterium]